MEIVLYSRHASYVGQIGGNARKFLESENQLTAVGLQGIVNSPRMMYDATGAPSGMFSLFDATTVMQLQIDQIEYINHDYVQINPDEIEIIFPLTDKLSHEDFSADALNDPGSEKIEIVTNSKKIISCQLPRGIVELSHPKENRRFLLLRHVRLEIFEPDRLTEHLRFLLLNHRFVEAFWRARENR